MNTEHWPQSKQVTPLQGSKEGEAVPAKKSFVSNHLAVAEQDKQKRTDGVYSVRCVGALMVVLLLRALVDGGGVLYCNWGGVLRQGYSGLMLPGTTNSPNLNPGPWL